MELKLYKIHFILLSFLLALTAGCSSENIKPLSKEHIKNVSFEYSVEIGDLSNKPIIIKYWIKDTKMKIQMKNTTYFFDSKDNSIYTYNSATNTVVKEPDSKPYSKDVIPPLRKDIPNQPLEDYFEIYKKILNATPKETVNIEGVSCSLYDFSTSSETDKFYISRESGFPVKWEFIAPSYTKRVNISKLEFDKVTDSDIEVPSSATINYK